MTVETYLFFAILFYFLHVLSSVAGVLIADRLNIGDLIFDLKTDIKKMVVSSLIVLPVPVFLLYHVQHPGIIILYVLTFFIVVKIVYLGINTSELGIIVLANFIGMGIFRIIAISKLLQYLYVLFLLILIGFFIKTLIKKRINRKKQLLFEKERRAEIMDIVKKDPGFHTICYECKFFDSNQRDCTLDFSDKKKEMKLFVKSQLNTYCLYWDEFKYL